MLTLSLKMSCGAKRRRLARLFATGCVLLYATCDAAAGEGRQIPTAPAEFLALVNPVGDDQIDDSFMKKMARMYKRKCKSCHGVDGDGKGSKAEFFEIKPAAFSAPGYLANRKDGQLFWILMNGSEGTEMIAKGPGTRDNMTELEIWSVIAYMRRVYTR